MPGQGEYLPPVIQEYRADVAKFIADTEAAKAALKSFNDEADRSGNRVSADLNSAGRAAQQMGRETTTGTRDASRGLDDTGRAASRTAREYDNLDRSASRAARTMSGGGNNNRSGNMFSGLLPGGRRATDPFGAALALGPQVGPLVAGAAWPFAGTLAGLGPGAIGSAALFPMLRSAVQDLTQAYGTLSKQTDTYNAAAQQTATFLSTDSQALKGYNQFVQQLNPLQQGAIGLLSQQDVQWQNLTARQQAGIISLRNTNDVYKNLPQSMKTELNALLAEQKAWANLNPAQAAALQNYMQLHTAWDNLKSAAMPSVFSMIATFESAAVHALQPLLPLIQAAAAGWQSLGQKLDAAFTSPGYQNFVNIITQHTASSIQSWGTAVGNLATGFGHLFEIAVQSGFGDRFNQWLVNVTQHFKDWAQSSAGTDWVTRFMARLEANGPTTMSILGHLVDSLGRLVGILGANYGTLQILNLVATWLLDIMKLPFVGQAASLLLFAGSLVKLAEALKLFTILGGALTILRGIGPAIAALAVGQGVGGAIQVLRGTAGAAGAAAAGRGAAGAAGGAAGAASGAGGALAGLAANPAALVAGSIAIIGGALAIWQSHLIADSNKAAGVIRQSDGSVRAANQVGTTEVSQSFRDMANSVSGVAQVAHQAGGNAAAGFRALATGTQSAADKLKAVMFLGQTELGQQAGLFVQTWGGDVVAIGNSLKASGKTLDTAVKQTMDSVFQNMSQTSKASWAQWQQNEQTTHKMTFDQLNAHTKTDYDMMKTAVSGFIDDANNHLTSKRQADEQKLLQATTQFMTDANNGTIIVSQQQINKLGIDTQKFITDSTKAQTATSQTDYQTYSRAAQQDINTMGKDLTSAYAGATSALIQSVTAGMSSAQQAAVNEANKLGLNLNSLFNNGGSNPFSTGNGSSAANGVAKGVGGLAGGGEVHGPGSMTSDSIPMMVSNKEFVVNARAAQQHLSLLHAINSGKLRGMAGGGQLSYNPMMQGDVWMTAGAAFKPAIMAEAMFAKQAALVKQIQQMMASVGGSAGAVGPAFALAMALTGVSGADWLSGLEIIAKYESGFNPNAINLTDSNAAAGDPSRGLMQTIMSTFMAYHQAGTSFNIFDPVANIAAAINYIRAVYGSIDNVPGVRSIRSGGGYLPYDNGGWLMPGMHGAYNGTGQPEAILTAHQWSILASAVAGGGGTCVHVYLDSREMHGAVRRTEIKKQRRNGGSTMAPDNLYWGG